MSRLEQRPIIVALAGPNGAGKSTFYAAHLRASGLRFVNADELSRELGIDAYRAAEVAGEVRRRLFTARESFIFETVFSDPAQEKIDFLRRAADDGYTVLLCFIGLASAELSDERVAVRALEGGHDVPRDKLVARYPRSLANLGHAVHRLPEVRIYDNSVEEAPHRRVASFEDGKLTELRLPVPGWAAHALAPHVPATLDAIVDEVERARPLHLVRAVCDGLRVHYPTRRAPKIGAHVTLEPWTN